MDADTFCPPNYLAEVRAVFDGDAGIGALSAPYRHPVPGDPVAARAILRYELWMRYYQLNLWRIGSPFAFSALGSNLSFRLGAYRRAGGFPLRQAGEDFYLLQQLCKTTRVAVWCAAEVAPSARLSSRVPFGTGVVVGQPDLSLQETRFPFYDCADFDRIGQTYALWSQLFRGDVALPVDAFLAHRLKGKAPFTRMRKNFAADQGRFIRACYERLDGLRLLQCLRFYRAFEVAAGRIPPRDEDALQDLAKRLTCNALVPRDFATTPLTDLTAARDQWADWEHARRRTAVEIGLDAPRFRNDRG
nr:glycosyltransferase family 2 protein [Acanthopleuribacter pedis]